MTLQKHAKFENEYHRQPNRTEARRYQWGTLMKCTVNDVLLYKNSMPKQFYVVLMLWAGGKSQTAIAEELQIPVGTVKSRTSRGFKFIEKARARNRAGQLEIA